MASETKMSLLELVKEIQQKPLPQHIECISQTFKSTLYKVTVAKERQYLLKHIPITHSNKRLIDREIYFLNKHLQGSTCLKDLFKTPTDCYLLLPFIEGMDLMSWRTTHWLTEEDLRTPNLCQKGSHILLQVLQQMAWAVKHFHDQGVAHRDLKLENFILNVQGNGNILSVMNVVINVIDLEYACSLNSDKPYPCESAFAYGTEYYQAPEVQALSSLPYNDAKKLDIFSLGVCFFNLITGKHLIYKAQNQIKRSTLQINVPIIQDLIQQMTQSKQANRPTIDKVIQVLKGITLGPNEGFKAFLCKPRSRDSRFIVEEDSDEDE